MQVARFGVLGGIGVVKSVGPESLTVDFGLMKSKVPRSEAIKLPDEVPQLGEALDAARFQKLVGDAQSVVKDSNGQAARTVSSSEVI